MVGGRRSVGDVWDSVQTRLYGLPVLREKSGFGLSNFALLPISPTYRALPPVLALTAKILAYSYLRSTRSYQEMWPCTGRGSWRRWLAVYGRTTSSRPQWARTGRPEPCQTIKFQRLASTKPPPPQPSSRPKAGDGPRAASSCGHFTSTIS